MPVLDIINVDAPRTASGASPDTARLRKQAGAALGHVFYGTLLSAIRKSRTDSAFGHGGRGEQVFGAQLDALLAERMGEADRHGLADSVLRRYETRMTRMAQPTHDERPRP